MSSKMVIKLLLEDLVNQIDRLSEADILKIDEGNHELTLKLTKKKYASKSAKELSINQKRDLLKRIQECQSREDGRVILSRTLKNKTELEQFAKFLDVLFLKQDKVDQIRDKIVDATVGAVLRSNAIQGKKPNKATIN